VWLFAFAGTLVLGLLCGTIWQFHAATVTDGASPAAGIRLRPEIQPDQRLTVQLDEADIQKCLTIYMDLTGRKLFPPTNGVLDRWDEAVDGRLSRWKLIPPLPAFNSGITFHADGALRASELKDKIEAILMRSHLQPVSVGKRYFRLQSTHLSTSTTPGNPPAGGAAGLLHTK